MLKYVPVGTSYSYRLYLTRVVSALSPFVMLTVARSVHDPKQMAWMLGFIGLVFAILTLAGYMVIAITKKRRWIAPTDTGFVTIDRRGAFEFADEDVSDLAIWSKKVDFYVGPGYYRRTGNFGITNDESTIRFPFTYILEEDTPDPLGPMLDRVLDKLTTAVKARIKSGGRLVGDGWTLTRDELVYTAGQEDVSLPVSSVAMADVVDDKVCVRATGEAEAALRVPARANAS